MTRFKVLPFTTVQPTGSLTSAKQVIDHHMFCIGSEVARQFARWRCEDTPGRGEFTVVEERSLEFDHPKHFGKYIHAKLPRLSGKFLGTLDQIILQKSVQEQERWT